MSENALRRIAIVMARDNGAFDQAQRLSAGVIRHRLEAHFPKHEYKLMSVKLYLLRLIDAGLVKASQRGGPPIYQLTEHGYAAASGEYWDIRDELGYAEPAVRSVTDTAAGIISATTKEFIPVAV